MNGALAPFERAALNLPPRAEYVAELMRDHGVDRREAIKQTRRLERDEIWLNNEYQVNIDREVAHGFGPTFGLIHLSIKRIDKAPIHDWRDLQAIKNMLVGDEYEGMELYPAESRLADGANQFHVWVLTNADGSAVRLPFGWTTRSVTSHPPIGAVQRPLPEKKP